MTECVARYRKDTELKRLCIRSGITYLALFGSLARGEEDADSDIDLLYKLKPGITYFEFYDIIEQLQHYFKKNIDAVPANHLRDPFKKAIENEIEVLYEEARR